MDLGFTQSARQDVKADELKQNLLDAVRHETKDFIKVADEFYQSGTQDDKSYIEFCQSVIAAIDRVLEAGDWNDSLFLRNTARPLKQLREKAQKLLDAATGESSESQEHAAPEINDDQIKAYVSLFQSDGHNLRKWELQLRSIESYLVGRPVYEKEEDVYRVVRAKVATFSEAYAVVVVNKSAIRDDYYEAGRTDRNGNILVSIMPGAIKPEHIVEFVHQGKRYRFIEGQLIG